MGGPGDRRDTENRPIPAGQRWARGVRGLSLWLLLALSSGPAPAEASAALILDDSETVGRGQVEIVVASAVLERGATLSYEAPLLDITLGLTDGLDFGLIASPTHGVNDSESLPTQGNIGLGLKWQFLKRPNFSASVNPAVDINVRDSSNLVVHFPAQLQYQRGRLLWGVAADYALVMDSSNAWLVGTWAGWSLKKSLLLLGEVWALTANEPDGVDFGFNLGVEWLSPLGVTVLASAGTDFAAFGAERIKWRGFLGFLWRFKLWGPTKTKVRINRPRRVDANRPEALWAGLRANL